MTWLALVVTAVVVVAVAGGAAKSANGQDSGIEEHPAIDDPAVLTDDEAEAYYVSLQERLASGYALSDDLAALRYQGWQRYNTAPYRSQTHGNRYVNNYANDAAAEAGYGDHKPSAMMPPGAVIAKDSFTVTHVRARYPGALFIMEKLPPGNSPETADWRYAMILPDGSFYGDSAEPDGKESMMFCHECHAMKADTDYLFFLPEAYRKGAADR